MQFVETPQLPFRCVWSYLILVVTVTGEKPETSGCKKKQRTNQRHSHRGLVDATGSTSSVLSAQGGTTAGVASALRKCALVSEGRRRM